MPRQITEGESFGSSVHNTLKKWGDLEMGNQESIAKGQLEMFRDTKDEGSNKLTEELLIKLWHSSFIIEGYESRLEVEFNRKRGEELMHKFFEWWQQVPRKALVIEKGFKIDLNDLILTGRFDRIEEADDGIHVIDYKTSKPRSQAEVDADLQLSIYALASEKQFDQPCAKLTLLYLSEDEFVERTTERTKGQLKDAAKQIHSIFDQIEQKEFHPTPSKDICRCCPYRGVCDASAVN